VAGILEDDIKGRGDPGQRSSIGLRSIELPRAVHDDRGAAEEHH
jgi:hypothetical protein